jgi:hypothetical protein
MGGNAAYKHMGMKAIGLFGRLFGTRDYCCDEAKLTDSKRENRMLLASIRQARRDWLIALSNFEHADNDDLIDYYIYKMKACLLRYNYLLKKAKEIGLKNDIEWTDRNG